MRKSLIYLLLLGIVWLSACNSELRKIEKSNDYDKKLEYANKLFDKKKYNKAYPLYEELINVFKGTKNFEDLYYRYAYAAYYLKDYQQASFQFKNFVELFPTSPRAEEAEFLEAYCYYKLSPKVSLDQTNTNKAIAAMQTFIDEHPNGKYVQQANDVIDKCRRKLEQKEYNSADLYYNLGHYKAAGIAFSNLLRNYADSDKGDTYKFMAIKAYYRYAENSIQDKQQERYDQVITEYLDFIEKYPNSKLKEAAEKYYNLAKNNLKTLQNEQIKARSQQ